MHDSNTASRGGLAGEVSVIPCLFSCVSSAALAEPQICYVLDGILFVYGIILTALYCRIKVYMLYICFYRNIQGPERNLFNTFYSILHNTNYRYVQEKNHFKRKQSPIGYKNESDIERERASERARERERERERGERERDRERERERGRVVARVGQTGVSKQVKLRLLSLKDKHYGVCLTN
uniref:Uncharacterized protein n=1 Tax=Seriola lalandi dorsalis TaxID=1841481 RepID=A0A3B4Y0D8_SERLL